MMTCDKYTDLCKRKTIHRQEVATSHSVIDFYYPHLQHVSTIEWQILHHSMCTIYGSQSPSVLFLLFKNQKTLFIHYNNNNYTINSIHLHQQTLKVAQKFCQKFLISLILSPFYFFLLCIRRCFVTNYKKLLIYFYNIKLNPKNIITKKL